MIVRHIVHIGAVPDMSRLLRALMFELRIGTNDLAGATGMTPTFISRLRSGGAAPSLASLLLIAEALGYDLALIPREDEPDAADRLIDSILREDE